MQHTPKHHTRVFFSSDDRQSNFPKAVASYQSSSMRSERENETINKAGGRGGRGSRRAERQRQNPKREIDAAGALTAAGTCEGAKAAAEVAQRAATASFMVKLFWGDINQREWIEGQRRTGSARGERSKRQRQQGGRPLPRPHSSPRRLASRTLVVFVQIGTLAECLHTLIAYTRAVRWPRCFSCSSPSSSRMRWCEQYEQNTGTTVHVRVLVASSS